MATVSFKQGTLAQYEGLSVVDESAIYFITDVRRIYKGSALVASDTVEFLSTVPSPMTSVDDRLYVSTVGNKTTIYIKRNGEMVPVGGGEATDIADGIVTFSKLNENIICSEISEDDPSDTKLTTEYAVNQYVQDVKQTIETQIQDIADALEQLGDPIVSASVGDPSSEDPNMFGLHLDRASGTNEVVIDLRKERFLNDAYISDDGTKLVLSIYQDDQPAEDIEVDLSGIIGDATSVKITEEITLTTSVGELPANTVIEPGTSIQDILTQILCKSKDPTKTNPSVSAFTVKNKADSKTSFESGSYVTPKWDSTFGQGSYTYMSTPQKDPITPVSGTGVTAQGWSIKMGSSEIGTTEDGEMSEQIQIEDADITFTAQVSYSDGNYALTNLKKLPANDVRISAGSASKTAKLSHFRNGFFWGILTSSSEDAPMSSDIIRAGTAKGSAYAAGNIGTSDNPIIKASSVPGCKRIFIACPATNKGVTKVVMPSAMGADATSDFVKMSTPVSVLGANGYTGIAYNVWVYEPASISEDQTFVVTLG